jgi:hypothetical protein
LSAYPEFEDVISLVEGMPGTGKSFGVDDLVAKMLNKHHKEYLNDAIVINTTSETAENLAKALKLKKLYYQYKARRLVIDANGVGLGLIDYMIMPSIDNDTGEEYPDFGVMNDEENYYKQYKTANTEHDAMYLIKANAPMNTEAHANIQSQMSSGNLKLLIDERTAKNKLLGTTVGAKMTPE